MQDGALSQTHFHTPQIYPRTPVELPAHPCPSTRPGDHRELCRRTYRRTGGGAGHGNGGTVLGAQFLQSAFSGVSTLLGVLQLVLHLAELGQVHGGDLLLQATQRSALVPPDLAEVLGCINEWRIRYCRRDLLSPVKSDSVYCLFPPFHYFFLLLSSVIIFTFLTFFFFSVFICLGTSS